MLGYIGESEKQTSRKIEFSKSLGLYLAVFAPTTQYLGTALYREAVERGFVKGDYLADFTRAEEEGRLPFFREGMEEWTRRAYYAFYFRPSVAILLASRILPPSQICTHLRCLRALVKYRYFSKKPRN